MTFGGTRIELKRAIKYLGVIIDDRLNLREISEKASVTRGALARMMPNIGEPGSFKRKIISAAQYGRKHTPRGRQGEYCPRCIV